LKKMMERIGLRTLSEAEVKQESSEFALDPAKVTIFTNELGMTGYELERVLDRDYGIQIECANYDNIIIIIKCGTTERHLVTFARALKEISDQQRKKKIKINFEFGIFNNEQVIEPSEAFFRRAKWVDFDQAKNEICAETISVYPPGIPALIPGERIAADVFDYLSVIKQKGASISSLDQQLKRIRVVDI